MLRCVAAIAVLSLASGCAVINGLGSDDGSGGSGGSDARVSIDATPPADTLPACTARLCYRETRLTLAGNASDITLANVGANPSFVVSTWNGYLTVFEGQGDGTFVEQQSFMVKNGVGAGALAGDFDGDGTTDVASFNHTDIGGGQRETTVHVFYRGLVADTTFLVSGAGERAAVGFFSDDNRADIVMTTEENELVVVTADGARTWSISSRTSYPGSARDLVIGSFDANTLDDVAVGHWNKSGADNDGVTVFLQGAGAGLFDVPKTFPTSPAPTALTAAQISGPAPIEDFVVAKGCTLCTQVYDLVRVYQPSGNQDAGYAWQSGMGMNAVEVIQEDFDNDGLPDIAMLNDVGDNVNAPELLVLLAETTGDLTPQWFSLGDAGTENVRFITADFNGDDRLDFAIAKAEGQEIILLMSDETLRD